MTGRELILYILENGLEDEPIVKDGKLIGFLTVSEVAAKFGVGYATVGAWAGLGMIPFVEICGEHLFPANIEPPTITKTTEEKT